MGQIKDGAELQRLLDAPGPVSFAGVYLCVEPIVVRRAGLDLSRVVLIAGAPDLPCVCWYPAEVATAGNGWFPAVLLFDPRAHLSVGLEIEP